MKPNTKGLQTILTTMLLSFSLFPGHAQTNLIANPGFEVGPIPTNIVQLPLATDWENGCTFGTPTGVSNNNRMLFDTRASSCDVGIPLNIWGTQDERTNQNRYAGIGVGGSIRGSLTQTLSAGLNYEVSFWASAPEGEFYGCLGKGGTFPPSPQNTIEIGLRKSNVNCNASSLVVYLSPSVIDQGNWVQYSGTFSLTTAQAAQGYDVIEFRTTSVVGGTGTHYIYIDDVSLVEADPCNVPFTASINAVPPTICKGDQATISVNVVGGSGQFLVQWSHFLGPGFTKTVSPSQSTTYTATIIDLCSSQVVTNNITVVVDELDVDCSVQKLGNPNSPTSLKFNATLNPAGVPPYNYVWTGSVGGSSISSGIISPAVTNNFTVLYNPNYNVTVTVTDANECSATCNISNECPLDATIQLNVPQPFCSCVGQPDPNNLPAIVPATGNPMTVFNTSGATNYTWEIVDPNGVSQYITSGPDDNLTFCTLTEGNYTINLTVSDGVCDATSQLIIPIVNYCAMITDVVCLANPCQVLDVSYKSGDPLSDLKAGEAEQLSINNWPNPFGASTKIVFHLPQSQSISLEVYDYCGRLIDRLISDQWYDSGSYNLDWESNNLPSGMYYYRLITNEKQLTGKMILMK